MAKKLARDLRPGDLLSTAIDDSPVVSIKEWKGILEVRVEQGRILTFWPQQMVYVGVNANPYHIWRER